jgi:hypothetical protein
MDVVVGVGVQEVTDGMRNCGLLESTFSASQIDLGRRFEFGRANDFDLATCDKIRSAAVITTVLRTRVANDNTKMMGAA